ncbi:MAG: hypothetical protein U1F35_23000 [Steroidobacteraceae bacterium]
MHASSGWRDILRNRLAELADRNVRDGAALVVDNASGEVLAYVGSAGPASRSPAVDGVRAPRQASSTLKPFLYELAIRRRWLTAASLLEDAPLTLDTGTGIYLPQDYDHEFKGLVSVRTALAGSLNVPAVRTWCSPVSSRSGPGCSRWDTRADRGWQLLRVFAGARIGGSDAVAAGARLPDAGARQGAARPCACSPTSRPHRTKRSSRRPRRSSSVTSCPIRRRAR